MSWFAMFCKFARKVKYKVLSILTSKVKRHQMLGFICVRLWFGSRLIYFDPIACVAHQLEIIEL